MQAGLAERTCSKAADQTMQLCRGWPTEPRGKVADLSGQLRKTVATGQTTGVGLAAELSGLCGRG